MFCQIVKYCSFLFLSILLKLLNFLSKYGIISKNIQGVILTAKNKIDLKDELRDIYFDVNLLQKIDCSKEDNKKYIQMLKNGETLPNGVFEYKYDFDEEGSGTFYTIHKPELTPEERLEYITFKQLKMLNTIKNCVVYFTSVSIISAILALLSFMSNS